MTGFSDLGLSSYWVGVIGAGAVEFFVFARAVAKMDGALPMRYKRIPHICTRIVWPFVCGTVPLMFGAETPLMALYLGASAPLFYDRLAEGVAPRVSHDGYPTFLDEEAQSTAQLPKTPLETTAEPD